MIKYNKDKIEVGVKNDDFYNVISFLTLKTLDYYNDKIENEIEKLKFKEIFPDVLNLCLIKRNKFNGKTSAYAFYTTIIGCKIRQICKQQQHRIRVKQNDLR